MITWSNALNKGEYCIGIFIDLRKAFDVCSHKILLKKLKYFGINNIALEWFRSYLANRVQQVDVGGCLSDQTTINISVMQGSILGPILFLCYINDLPNSSALKTLLFADDTQGYMSGKNLPLLIDQVNNELKKWASWFKSIKMAVNVKKTKFIVFHSKGKNVNEPDMPFDHNKLSEIGRITSDHVNRDIV
jgi:Reverse transcriptase (RNA-dependent DNA polymerase)